jgi:hypothetical protein
VGDKNPSVTDIEACPGYRTCVRPFESLSKSPGLYIPPLLHPPSQPHTTPLTQPTLSSSSSSSYPTLIPESLCGSFHSFDNLYILLKPLYLLTTVSYTYQHAVPGLTYPHLGCWRCLGPPYGHQHLDRWRYVSRILQTNTSEAYSIGS